MKLFVLCIFILKNCNRYVFGIWFNLYLLGYGGYGGGDSYGGGGYGGPSAWSDGYGNGYGGDGYGSGNCVMHIL